MDRYNLALVLMIFAVGPVFYISIWLGVAAVLAIYGLTARLANRDLNRQFRKHFIPVRQVVIDRHRELERSLHA
jgi:hypothetical protein